MINNHKDFNCYAYDPGFDKAYNDVDRHGISGKAPEVHYDPGFDKAYNDVDRHGIPGKAPEVHYDPSFDKAYNDVDRHGIPGKAPEVYYDPGFDKAYNDVDRHGIGTVYYPDREKFDTNSVEIQEFCKAIITAEAIEPKGYDQLELLPEKAIKSIIESRYINSANKLESGYDEKFVKTQISTDLELISKMVLAGKNLYENDINISNKLGGLDFQNIIGVLNGYESWIQGVNFESKIALLDSIAKIKAQAISQAEQLGYINNQK